MDYNKLKEKALASGIEDIELYTKKENSISISYFDNEVEQREDHETCVYAIRGVYNGHIATVYSERGDDEAICYVIEHLKKNASHINSDEPFFIYEGDKDYEEVYEVSSDVSTLSTEFKLELMSNIVKELQTNSDFFHAEVGYEEKVCEVLIENSKGLSLKRNYAYAYLVAGLYAKRGEETKSGYDIKFVKNLSDFDYKGFAQKVIKDTVSQFGASPVKSGPYKTVLLNEVTCSLLNVYSSIFYASQVKKKASFLEGKLNEQVFGKNISIYDDPFLNEAPVLSNFDDEGVSTHKHEVVKDGVLKTYLHNLSTASYYNTKSTGNGFKNSVASNVSTAFNNLVLEAGDKSYDELLKEVGNGILITNITGLHAGVNQISGDFNVQCGGYVIENGVIGRAVNLIILSGKFQDLFNNVVSVANDSTYSNGVYAPSIYVKEMNISGN